MYKIIKNISIIFLFSFNHIYGQTIQGTVYEINDNQKDEILPGATLHWLGTNIGTVSDDKGNFSIAKIKHNNQLVVSFVGYMPDTIMIDDVKKHYSIRLKKNIELSEIRVVSDETVYISSRPILTQSITTDGIRKAACCNLSESFENTVSIDVTYSDAITGAKQIQMLGLAGIYTQILLENTPYIRGLSAPFGLMYIPGAWMESINISKGTSSVINGYESITGQIDVNYKNPERSKEKLFVNAFLNTMLKSELNLNTRYPVGKRSSHMFLFHFENQPIKLDGNKDGFIDAPLNTQVNMMYRMDYEIHGKMEGKTIASYLYENRQGGQMKFNKPKDYLTSNHYGIGIETHRMNLISKNGFFLAGEHESIGTIASVTYHKHDGFSGLKTYFADQLSGYLNIIYENFMDKKEQHKINAGLSYQADLFNEKFMDTTYQRRESVPGLFAQYSFIYHDKLVVIAGIRGDYNSLYGMYVTPRFHLKWQFLKQTSLRLSAGKGYRSPNVFIDNTALMNTSRSFVIKEKLKAEKAWNMGANITQTFKIKGKESTFIIDYFYTDFVNQVIVDVDKNPQFVYFYNSEGKKSFAHSFQAELMLYPFKGFEIITAYRYNYVMQTIDNVLIEKALSGKHRALINIGYATKFDKWKFNITTQFHGSQRLPNTKTNPENYQLANYSPNFITLNAQITKKFKYFEIYVGAENITNYKQKNPIIASEDPFNQYFDSSIIWGPIDGIMGYCGVRFTLKNT
ncbi:MAG TPA: TonB-dependent receptor [Bacteroidales bacterium]|nr:TonB-dependent receptor [Bacteroidales bacterium]HOR82200.1 TonB-dependent receptor [Bacteroidales bacterium]HPJ91350.1 TonB-dependent receptor [Bacteroidales bacterium]